MKGVIPIGTESIFGGAGGWLIVFVILILLFGGGNFFGGNRAESVETIVQNAINAQSTQTGLRDVLLSSNQNNYETAMLISNQNLLNAQQHGADQVSILQGFNALSQALGNLSSKLDTCCCDIKTTFLQGQYEDALRELNKAQIDAATKAQSEYLLSVMGKWVANPASATA